MTIRTPLQKSNPRVRKKCCCLKFSLVLSVLFISRLKVVYPRTRSQVMDAKW